MSPAAPSDLPPYDEAATFDELVFALGQRDQPTVALIECASLAKRRELEAQMAERMPEYRFHVLDVTPFAVTSLLHTLNEHLPEEIKASAPVTWVVQVHGLEDSYLLNQEGDFVPSPLTAQLNLERELLFRSVPYLIVLWGDAGFFRALQREAPDFWHWVTYRFRFEDHTARPVAEMPPLPPERLSGEGNVPERQARIAELKERAEHTSLDDVNKLRRIRDKATLLSLLGDEYTEAFQYEDAAKAYRDAIALLERTGGIADGRAKTWASLGNAYQQLEQYPQALAALERSRELADDLNQCVVYHQIGLVYQAQKQWVPALENYQLALRWMERRGDGNGRGGAYHQIGVVYAGQQQWSLAFANYRQAIKWYQRTGEDTKVGGSYHQIGIAYQRQKRWALAMKNYRLALDWYERTGNEFATGGTYYQIARVYGERRMFWEALPFFEKAIACFTKYGDPFLPHAEEELANARERGLMKTKNEPESGRKK